MPNFGDQYALNDKVSTTKIQQKLPISVFPASLHTFGEITTHRLRHLPQKKSGCQKSLSPFPFSTGVGQHWGFAGAGAI
jgi:hypothetical protein